MDDRKSVWGRTALVVGMFLLVYWLPFDAPRVEAALREAFLMLSEYAREHVLLCLVPAFFIAAAIMVFVRQDAVLRYLGPRAAPAVAYGVASVSGALLAVCSCTVLPVFKGIYRKGAGLGPAVAFLYSGPAINVLAVVLTARVLGWRLGLARTVGSVLFAVLVGLAMAWFFRGEDQDRTPDERMFRPLSAPSRPLWKEVVHVGLMVLFLLALTWKPSAGTLPWWDLLHRWRWWWGGAAGALVVVVSVAWFSRDELGEWMSATRDFALQILPLLFAGVWVAGFLLGRPGHEGLIPSPAVAALVGGNGLGANLFASVAGALMYFATLTEVPILQGLLGAGMGQGPALALLLAGPSLSLPSMLVIAAELGWKKTLVYVLLVVVLSTLAGWIFGHWI